MMALLRRKAIHVFMITSFLLAMAPLQGDARLYIKTEIATGQVIKIQDHVITLDSGIKFYPHKKNIKIEIKVGDDVTVKFFTDAEKTNKYTEIAIGKNSLFNAPVPETKLKGFK